MSRTLLVVPTGAHVGLTSACLALLRALDERGVRVGYVKPLAQPHADGAPDPSADLVRKLTSLHVPEPMPALEVEDLLGAVGGVNAILEEVVVRWQGPHDRNDVVVIEGLSPGPTQMYSGRVNQAMAQALDAQVILVSTCPTHDAWPGERANIDDWDGVLDHLGENLAIAASTYRTGEQDRAVGCVVTRVPSRPPDAGAQIAAEARRRNLHLLAAVPFQSGLTHPRVQDLVHHIRPRLLSAGELGRRIKEVSIFAQSVPGGLRALTDDALIVVPGDRHDAIMAACLAALNGTRLAALLLTVGIEPDPKVWLLADAAIATGLPILLTDDSTFDAAMRVRDIDVGLSGEDIERADAVMTHGAAAVDFAVVHDLLAGPVAARLSPAAFRYRLTSLAREADARIVLPEGTEPRTLRAAAECARRGIARPVLLAAPADVQAACRSLGLQLPDAVTVVDPGDIVEQYVEPLAELRAHKGWTLDVARERLTDRVTLATMMLRMGDVDGLVAGAEHTTAQTVRPALQILGTREGAALVSSVFFMCLPNEVLVYGDCAINPNPDAEELADIAIQSAGSARAFGIEPRIAMISFSTGSSGIGADVRKVAAATQIVRDRAPDLVVDGPMQYDAAAAMSVAKTKAPDSVVAGRATVFVFPTLDSGNTTYKAVQRSADVTSIGPMLQGLSKPVNDLSRGALVEDIVYTIALTAVQAGAVASAEGHPVVRDAS